MVVTQIGSSRYEVMETASNNERVRINKMKDGSRINEKMKYGRAYCRLLAILE